MLDDAQFYRMRILLEEAEVRHYLKQPDIGFIVNASTRTVWTPDRPDAELLIRPCDPDDFLVLVKAYEGRQKRYFEDLSQLDELMHGRLDAGLVTGFVRHGMYDALMYLKSDMGYVSRAAKVRL